MNRVSCDSQVAKRAADLVLTEGHRGRLGRGAQLKEKCASLRTQTTPYLLCEVSSGRIRLVNGTQVSGLDCVCLARGLCLFSLANGPQLSAAAGPELIGSQWAGEEAPLFLFFYPGTEQWMNLSRDSDNKIQDVPERNVKATH